MGNGTLPEFELELECVTCEKSFTASSKSVGQTVTCPHCGQQIELVDDGFSDGLKAVDEKIQQSLKDIEL
jgi:hypothetical protein